MSDALASTGDAPAMMRRDGLDYPFPEPPGEAEIAPVAPGVFWLRMPLPFALDHINLWLLEDGARWVMVDTGLCDDTTKGLWRRLADGAMAGRPVDRILVTHFHPDHMGLAGWLADTFEAPVHATQTEYLMASMLQRDTEGILAAAQVAFYRENGLAEEWLEPMAKRGNTYRERIAPPPVAYRRMADEDELEIGGNVWRVVVGRGHAPEHACLYCESLGVLISGDQVLPRITPNVSLFAAEPDSDPLALFLATMGEMQSLPAETLVLPSHGLPFYGLHTRARVICDHHDDRLDDIVRACDRPMSGAEMIPVLFRRELDVHQAMFAMGESLSHLAHLHHAGRLVRDKGSDGVIRYAPR